MKKECPECGDTFQGRVDKRYCSASCRSSYHNKTYAGETAFIRRINKTLRENRRLLAEFNPDGKARLPRRKLLEAGFNFRYFTNEYTTRNGNIYRFCYDQGYAVSDKDEDYLLLVVRQEYVD